MDDLFRKSLAEALAASRGPLDLVEQFRALLKEQGAELVPREYDSGCKVFGACLKECSIVVLAHESREVGLWDIVVRHVENLKRQAAENKSSLQGWGAALLDQSPKRGFWIEGPQIEGLVADGFAYLKKAQKYLFESKRLLNVPEAAKLFCSIEEFLTVSGLVAKERWEIPEAGPS